MYRRPLLALWLCGLVGWIGVYRCEAQNRNWEERDRWQNVPGIFEAMGVHPGAWVADVGSREGYLTVRLSRAVGDSGRVFAVDIDQKALDRLAENLEREQIGNVTAVHSVPDDPMLPAGAFDAVVIVNAYHEMDEYASMLQHIRDALKPGGRLVLVEPIAARRRDASRNRQTSAHEIAIRYARADLEEAGFEIVEARDPFVERGDRNDQMWLLVGRRSSGDR